MNNAPPHPATDRGKELRMRFRSPTILAAVLCAGVILITTGDGRAQVDPFEFEVYQTQTYGAGMFELEWHNSFVPQGHTQGERGTSSGDYASNLMYRTSLETAYGITDRIEAGAYVSFARPNGASFQFAGSKYRLRGSLFEQGELLVDLGWYVELEWHRIHQFDENELELEFKPLIEKNFGKVETISTDIRKRYLSPQESWVEFAMPMGSITTDTPSVRAWDLWRHRAD
jgi:hypothetical protein